jgi:hypothetical protein
MDSESCCAVDLEQWNGFQGAATGCLSYCPDKNLTGRGRLHYLHTHLPGHLSVCLYTVRFLVYSVKKKNRKKKKKQKRTPEK